MERTHLIQTSIDKSSAWIASFNFRMSYLRTEDPIATNNSMPQSEMDSTCELKPTKARETLVERESQHNTSPSQPAVTTLPIETSDWH